MTMMATSPRRGGECVLSPNSSQCEPLDQTPQCIVMVSMLWSPGIAAVVQHSHFFQGPIRCFLFLSLSGVSAVLLKCQKKSAIVTLWI